MLGCGMGFHKRPRGWFSTGETRLNGMCAELTTGPSSSQAPHVRAVLRGRPGSYTSKTSIRGRPRRTARTGSRRSGNLFPRQWDLSLEVAESAMSTVGELIVRVRDGDADAYDIVVHRFQDMAVGYGYSILHDFQLAEDAAQEAFFEAHRCLASLRDPAAFPGWFRRIVFKHCDRIMRRSQ